MSTITIAILIFVVTLILYGVNKFSMGTVGMITMAALLVTGCLAPKDALGYFAKQKRDPDALDVRGLGWIEPHNVSGRFFGYDRKTGKRLVQAYLSLLHCNGGDLDQPAV